MNEQVEAIAAKIVSGLETKAPSQIEWEIVEALKLVAEACPPIQQGWQSIETAPKDETEIIGLFHGYIRRVIWWSPVEGWMQPSGAVSSIALSHWQPLPLPPAPPPRAEQEGQES